MIYFIAPFYRNLHYTANLNIQRTASRTMSLCIKCSTVIRSFYLPHESDPYLSPNRTVSVMRRLTKGRIITKQGQDESYSFSSSVECKLCIMMATEISPRLLDCGQALISFSGSRSILKGWINSEPAFSFHVHIEDMEYDDHDTKVCNRTGRRLQDSESVD